MTRQKNSTRVQAPAQDSAMTAFDIVHPIYNEDLVLNPPGSIRSDFVKGKAEKLIKIKTPFLISAFNVRTLGSMPKKYEIAYLPNTNLMLSTSNNTESHTVKLYYWKIFLDIL